MFAVLSKRIGPLPVWTIGLALGGVLFYGAARARGGGDVGAGAQSLVDALKGGLPFNIGPGPGNVGMPGPVSSGGGSSSTSPGGGATSPSVGAPGPGSGSASAPEAPPTSDTGLITEPPPDAPAPAIARSTTDTSTNPADPTTTDPLIKTPEGAWVIASQLAKTTVPTTKTAPTAPTTIPTTSVSTYTYTPPPNVAYQEARSAPIVDPHAGMVNSRYGWVTPELLAQLYSAENAARMERTQPPTPQATPTVNGVPIATPPPLNTAKTPGGGFQYPTSEAETTPMGSAQGGTTPREAQPPGYGGGTGAATNSLSGRPS